MSPRWLIIAAIPALLAVGCGDDGARPAGAFSHGDWVEVVTEEDCTEVRPKYADFVASCPPEGSVGLVVEGPEEAGGRTWWSLAALGWVSEDSLRFHHAGDPPYPHRPELADAGRIAFVGPESDVWIMNGDGSGKRMILDRPSPPPEPGPGSDFVSLHWSPDGSKLAVADVSNEVVHILSADDDPIPTLHLETHQYYSSLVWSPAGDAFAITRPVRDRDFPSSDLLVFDLAGDTVLELPDAIEPAFSADGRRIGFFQIVGPGGLDLDKRGAVADLQTGEIEPIDPQEELAPYGNMPLWSPSEPSLLAYGDRLIDLDSGEELPLPGLAASWSPDGRFLLLSTCEGDVVLSQVYEVETSFSALEFEARIGATDAPCPGRVTTAWSPDGRYLAYLRWGASPGPARANALVVWDSASGETGTIEPFHGGAGFSLQSRHMLAVTFDEYPLYPIVRRGWIWVMDIDGSGYSLLAGGGEATWQPQP